MAPLPPKNPTEALCPPPCCQHPVLKPHPTLCVNLEPSFRSGAVICVQHSSLIARVPLGVTVRGTLGRLGQLPGCPLPSTARLFIKESGVVPAAFLTAFFLFSHLSRRLWPFLFFSVWASVSLLFSLPFSYLFLAPWGNHTSSLLAS